MLFTPGTLAGHCIGCTLEPNRSAPELERIVRRGFVNPGPDVRTAPDGNDPVGKRRPAIVKSAVPGLVTVTSVSAGNVPDAVCETVAPAPTVTVVAVSARFHGYSAVN